ncbi:hypothetical protein V8F33_007152 [Rhypophila sp. PSN 637]
MTKARTTAGVDHEAISPNHKAGRRPPHPTPAVAAITGLIESDSVLSNCATKTTYRQFLTVQTLPLELHHGWLKQPNPLPEMRSSASRKQGFCLGFLLLLAVSVPGEHLVWGNATAALGSLTAEYNPLVGIGDKVWGMSIRKGHRRKIAVHPIASTSAIRLLAQMGGFTAYGHPGWTAKFVLGSNLVGRQVSLPIVDCL